VQHLNHVLHLQADNCRHAAIATSRHQLAAPLHQAQTGEKIKYAGCQQRIVLTE
jgi:hypothetical protein